MADFLSRYTGQQIDSILESVDQKVSKNDVIDDFSVNDPLFPPSARLTYLLNTYVTSINDTLNNKVIRTDGGEQTISGRKKFSSIIDANGGINVPAQKSITIADEPVNSTDAVNLSMLKKHGVSEDTAGTGSGLKISLLPNGYNLLVLDASNLTDYLDTTNDPTSVVIQKDIATYKWSWTAFTAKIFSDSRFNGYVTTDVYDQDISDIETSLNAKVNTTTYNTKMSSLDTSIANLGTNKVDVSTYNTKMAALDTSISNLGTNKVDVSTYNTKMTSLDTSISNLGTNKVDVSTYNTKMTALDTAIAGRTTIGKTNTSSTSISASGNAALPDFDQVNLTVIYVTATWGTLVDTYRISMTKDGTLKTELLVQKSTAGTVTFAGSVVSGKLRLTITNANTSTACTVDYNMIVSF